MAQLLLPVLDATDLEITEYLFFVQMQAKYRENWVTVQQDWWESDEGKV